MSSQPEWMKKYNEMGLKSQVVTTVDKESGEVVQQSGPTSGEGGVLDSTPAVPHSPSRFDKFEHKVKPDPNASTPPWLANLKKKKAAMAATTAASPTIASTLSPRTSGLVIVEEDDAAALFAKAGTGGPLFPAGGNNNNNNNNNEDEDDAAALFFGGRSPASKSTAATPTPTTRAPAPEEALSPEQEDVSARYRKMIQMGT